MSWQDIVFSIGTLIFSVSLIPSIKSKDKPHIFTSLSTGFVLIVFAGTYWTLNLRYSFIMAIINAVMWLTLARQKYYQKHST